MRQAVKKPNLAADLADKAGDIGTNDIFVDCVKFHDKAAWMLRLRSPPADMNSYGEWRPSLGGGLFLSGGLCGLSACRGRRRRLPWKNRAWRDHGLPISVRKGLGDEEGGLRLFPVSRRSGKAPTSAKQKAAQPA